MMPVAGLRTATARPLAMLALAGSFAAGLPGCTRVSPVPPSDPSRADFCARSGGQQSMFITLAFGLSIPGGGAVSALQWSDFLAQTVTPRFPAGFSVFEAQGQWQEGPAKPVIRENSRLVWIVAPESSELRSKLDAIRKTYKNQFNQNSVAAFIQQGCASF
ncbi:DUF3574 domain-containing protein [Asaia sp. BMEF1]|uniref:DUF3574 domain-containing protein n=1 Tax=Asaia sp. BMEF1 TaxID=3155932 RepID=UPI003F677D5D